MIGTRRPRLFANAPLKAWLRQRAGEGAGPSALRRGAGQAQLLALIGPAAQRCMALGRPLQAALGAPTTPTGGIEPSTSEAPGPDARAAEEASAMVACRPLRGQGGRVYGCHCTLLLGRAAEAGLHGEAARAAEVAAGTFEHLHQLPWPTFVLAPSGAAQFLNAAARCYLAHQAGRIDVLGQVHPDDRQTMAELWRRAQGRHRALHAYARLRTHDGAHRWCMLRLEPCLGTSGEVDHWLGVALPTTDLQHALRQQARIDAHCIGNSFLTVASHELRTPLTSLQLNLQMALQRLERASDAGPGRGITGMVARSLKQTHRLVEVVSDILDASRIEHGKLQLRCGRVELRGLLQETLALFERPLAEVGCTVSLSLGDGIVGQWDRGRIEQVFFDLLANVLKHAPGSHVRVCSSIEAGVATVAVHDDGPGIPPQMHERVFDRFARANENRGISGLGLGLYLCRQIVAEHGGTLTVQGGPGLGTTFTARLPLGPALPARPEGAPQGTGQPSPGRACQRAPSRAELIS